MNIKHILAIAKLEMRRKKKSYNPYVLVFLLVLVGIFFASAWLLFSYGTPQTVSYYDIYTSEPAILPYLEDSSFHIDRESDTSFFVHGDRYRYVTSRSIENNAAQSAFLQLIKQRNQEFLLSTNVTYLKLLYLNVTPLFREEIVNLNETFHIDEEVQTVDDAQSALQEDTPILEETVTEEVPLETETLPQTSSLQLTTIEQNEPLAQTALTTDGLQTPDDISSFAFIKDLFIFLQILFVLNIAGGLFGITILQEKTNQKSSLLFIANVTKWEFLIGKAIPYFVGVYLLFLIIVGVQNTASLLHFPVYIIGAILIMLYLGLSCLNGMLARNQKEYSFLNVFSIIGISLYLLIPAFLSNISQLSYASLLTPLSLYAQGMPVSFPVLLFVLPAYAIVTILLFYICSCAWNYEELYTFHTPFQKLLLLLSSVLTKLPYYFFYGGASVAFAWIAQLLVVAFLLTTEFSGKTVVFVFLAAYIEEFLRNMGFFAKQTFSEDKPKKMFLHALAVGLGFMMAEKGFLLITIAPYLQGFEVLVLSGLLAPLLLHTLLSYLYLRMTHAVPFLKRHYLFTTLLLAIIHSIVNLLILHFAGGLLG